MLRQRLVIALGLACIVVGTAAAQDTSDRKAQPQPGSTQQSSPQQSAPRQNGTTAETAPQQARPPLATPATGAPSAGTGGDTQAPGQVALPPELIAQIERLSHGIKTAETTIERVKELEGELTNLRTSVESLLGDAQETAEQMRPRLDEVKILIEKLGPEPAAGQPAEPKEISAERQRLRALQSQLDGAIKSTELTWVRARQLIEKITVMRHALFTQNLFERRPSPLLPAQWNRLLNDAPAVWSRIKYLSGDWWQWASQHMRGLLVIGGAATAAFVMLKALALALIAGGKRRTVAARSAGASGSAKSAGSFFERALTVAWIAPLRMLPPAAAVIIVYAGLDYLDLLFSPWDELGAAALRALLTYIAIATLINAALSPSNADWRLVPFSSHTARRIDQIARLMIAIYALDYALVEASKAFYIPLSLTVVQSLTLSQVFALLLMALALTPFEFSAEADGAGPFVPTAPLRGQNGGFVSRFHPGWVKGPMWAIAVAIMAAAGTGYASLAQFMAHQLVLTLMVISVTGLGYLAVRALTRPRRDGRYAISDALETRFGIEMPRQRQLARFVESVLTCALGLVAAPFLLLQWGFASADIQDWLKAAIFGFDIGHFHISLARILIGAVLFIALLFATRVSQKWLREGMLSPSRVDPGIANSIDQALGYAGIVLAALLAASYAGFDITSLAIVAGALSVGIGFGLQSIVNNFVSGLILLVERPIKVGDWVVVGDQQGNVRRISVRSTEIETFDKASLIVPNSELVSGRVLNWTHRNLLGRVVIRFSLEIHADPEVVLQIMLACAKANPQVMATPAPIATLDQFSPAGLDFSLRTTLGDITRGTSVLTDLRIAILKELRKAHQIGPPAPAVEAKSTQ